MTPTLLGRWQIRIFLLGTVGLLIAFLVGLSLGGQYRTPLLILLYVFVFGLVWDVLYQIITSYRWERDWPTSFQVAAGIIEGALVGGVVWTVKLPGITQLPPFYIFLIQYGITWLSIFLLTQGPLRIFSLKWRYHGGQWFVAHKAQPRPSVSQQQPVPQLQVAGGYGFPQPVSQPQLAGGYNFPQPTPQPQLAGGYNFPQVALPPQTVRANNPNPYPSQGDLVGAQTARTYACACGFSYDPTVANFCPRCGRPKVQQGVS